MLSIKKKKKNIYEYTITEVCGNSNRISQDILQQVMHQTIKK